MTFSIVAFDPATGDLGVAVASKFPCVGAVVPWAKAGVGAVATQAWANTAFGPDGLGLMAGGMPAAEALDAVLEGDDGRDERQAGFVDGRGGAATFTGSGCVHWAGGVTDGTIAAQGNILVGEAVVKELVRAFGDAEGDLSDRLLAALLAGDAAGGDRRGKQSAALLVVREGGGYEGRNDRYIDLRVDDHPDAPSELARLFGVWDDTMLIRNDPLLDPTPDLVADMQRRLAGVGRYDGEVSGAYDARTRAALEDWAGWYNLEGRLREDDRLSQHLLSELRDVTPEIT
jgi:uncharacterized Ntn-hydrolase superfamily protein